MGTMGSMSRTPNDKSKIQGNSLPEVVRAWKQCALDLADDSDILSATRGALRDGNLLNAFLLYCLGLEPDERKEAALRGLRTLEHLKLRDEPLDLKRFAPREIRALGAVFDREAGEAESAKGDRPKGANRPRGSSGTKRSKRMA